MNDEAGKMLLLAAIEALHDDIRALRKEAREDREAREQLSGRKAADAERQARHRERLRSQNSHVTSRDNNVTQGSLEVLKQETKDLKTPALRDNHATSRDTGPTWAAYSAAYETRYGVRPVRNGSVNSKMAQFVKRIGVEESPAVAAFFVAHNLAWYVQKQHPVGLMLSECEGLRTQWANGRSVTATAARQADKTQANSDVFSKFLSGGANVGTK